jgi:NADH:ubiquinone oxidoreductase subunit 3 (subunit A)
MKFEMIYYVIGILYLIFDLEMIFLFLSFEGWLEQWL